MYKKHFVIDMVILTKSQNHRDKELYRKFNIERSNNVAQKLCRGYRNAEIFFNMC